MRTQLPEYPALPLAGCPCKTCGGQSTKRQFLDQKDALAANSTVEEIIGLGRLTKRPTMGKNPVYFYPSLRNETRTLGLPHV
jgi:hypothetical protein